MGYFPNGCSGDDYIAIHCKGCYWEEKACPIWLAHMEYNYEECNNNKSILDILIPRSEDGLSNKKCRGFVPIKEK